MKNRSMTRILERARSPLMCVSSSGVLAVCVLALQFACFSALCGWEPQCLLFFVSRTAHWVAVGSLWVTMLLVFISSTARGCLGGSFVGVGLNRVLLWAFLFVLGEDSSIVKIWTPFAHFLVLFCTHTLIQVFYRMDLLCHTQNKCSTLLNHIKIIELICIYFKLLKFE